MATQKQKKAFDKTLENGGNVTKAMREAKYKETTINNPKNLTESKGFEELMDEAGLTDEFLNNCLYDDIKAKKYNRKSELELAFKVKGKLKDKVEHSGNINIGQLLDEC
jgi:hypothetical protein